MKILIFYVPLCINLYPSEHMKAISIIFLAFFHISCFSQTSFYQFMNRLDTTQSEEERNSIVDEYIGYMESEGIPYIEGDTAYFIYVGDADSVHVAGDFNGWSPGADKLLRVEGTDFFYLPKVFEPDARLDYKLIVNSTWILDPKNPSRVSGGFGPNSELAMPDYMQPWEINEFPDVPKGTISSFSYSSAFLDKNFRVQIYLPPGYDTLGSRDYPSVYVQDGQEYISLGDMNNVLDNLIDSNLIDPLIGVFIRPNNRNEEYAFDQRFDYIDFITQELVPYIDSAYFTLHSPEYRGIMGASFGANISALISHSHPDLFQLCGMHSPAIWPNEFEAGDLLTNDPQNNLKIYFNKGTYEDLGFEAEDIGNEMLSLGYTIDWDVYHEGHSWGLWRATTDDILKFLFPQGMAPQTSITQQQQRAANISAYPNPAQNILTISLTHQYSGKYSLQLFDITGVKQFEDNGVMITTGTYHWELDISNLNEGIYFIRILSGKEQFTLQVVISRK